MATLAAAPPRQQAQRLALALGAGLVAALWPLSGTAAALALMLFATFAGAVSAGLRRYPHPRLGACNAVTLLRGALAAGLSAPLAVPGAFAAPAAAWGFVAVAAATLALDGADGWLARRSGLASGFGARFDMETDAALALILAAGLIATGKAGVWVLALGGLRYAFVAAAALVPWLNAPLPDSLRRKTVCVIQIAALIALHAPWVQPPASTALAAAATAALVWSFAVDVVWLWRRR